MASWLEGWLRMEPGLRWAGVVGCLGLLVQPAMAGDGWNFEIVYLKKGQPLQGLVVRESASEVGFKCVSRKPGSPTVVISTTILRGEIERIERLAPKEREKLAARLLALAKERETMAILLKSLDPTARNDPARVDVLELKPVPWGKDGHGKGLGYESACFRLISNAREDVTQLAALQLELIYAAYTRFLPPRRKAGSPTTVLLPQSAADYQALLKELGRTLLNPAYFDPDRNQILCAFELQRLSDVLRRAQQENDKLLKGLQDQEAELQKVYKGKIPSALATQLQTARQKIDQSNRQNRKDFNDATQRQLQRLYHEAFHAYLANDVYPPAEGEVPRWLNEGLAQLFEAASVEGGELRVQRLDRDRLTRVQALAQKGELVSLEELLNSGPKQFLVIHNCDEQTSDRYYLTSWALAYYLAFDRRLLGTNDLDQFVLALHRGTKPVEAFRLLVGQPLPEFAKSFRQYVQELRPDGGVGKPSGQ